MGIFLLPFLAIAFSVIRSAEAVPLAEFTVLKSALTLDKQKPAADKLTVKGEFRLASGETADPATETVTLAIGPFSQTLPPGAFIKKTTRRNTTWTFKGASGGLTEMTITLAGERWSFNVAATRLTLSGTTNPITIRLRVGDDEGSQSLFFVVTDTSKRKVFKFPGGRRGDADGDGFTVAQGDCNDQDPAIHPGATEVCNATDDDCNGAVDEGLGNLSCGVGACARSVEACVDGAPQECVPGTPTAEICGNGIDEDCNGSDPPCDTDTTPPNLSITAPADGSFVLQSRPAVEVSYSDVSGVNTASLAFAVNNTAIEVDCPELTATGARCIPNSDLPQGAVMLAAQVADQLDNLATTDVQFTVDSVPLAINITSPANGFITKEPEVPVTGTAGADVQTVTVNEVAASLSGGSFSATVPLREGTNMLVALGTKANGKTGTASIDVTRDVFAPTVRIDSPHDGFVSPNATIPVTGMVNDIVNGNVNAIVKVNGLEATVGDGTFMVPAVQLVRGLNTIEAVATDAVGNVGRHNINVSFEQPVGARLSIGSGNGQAATVNQTLPEPLVVVVKDDLGNLVAGRVVMFEVTRNNGVLRVLPDDLPKQTVRVPTDGSGKATVLLTLGDTAGEGNNRVTASALGVTGEVELCASALAMPPDKILMTMGDNQRGAIGNPLATPLEALVVDKAGNPIKGLAVTFTVVKGSGQLDGEQSLVRTTGTDGTVRAVLTLGPDPGINNNVVSATFAGLTGAAATFAASGLTPGNPADTKFSGVVLDNAHTPIPGALVTIEGSNASDTTDDQGQFLLENVPAGHIHLLIDPSSSPRPETFPPLAFETVTVAGQTNILGQPILIPALNTEESRIVGGDQDVTLKMKGVPGLELTVFANSVTCPEGTPDRSPDGKQCRVIISQVHLDKVPMPPPSGTIFMPPAWTVQPAGVAFNPPARIQIPNDGMPPGRVIDIFQFDHALNEFINVGKGTTSKDGLVIVSDPGFGITRAGWGGCGQPQPPQTCASSCDDKNPCTDDKCQNGSCVNTPRADGTACEASEGKSFASKGVTINIDKSCSKGACQSGACKPKSDRWGLGNLENATNDALGKIFDMCMGDPLRTTMQDKLKDKGFKIQCVDSGDTNGDGSDDCASAGLGGNTLDFSNLGSICGSVAKTVRHEMQHAAGNRNHTANVADDTVFACDLACYGTANQPGANAANCK
ncbi:MAG: MopE-related protein [Gammaproteobacteria bacterium]